MKKPVGKILLGIGLVTFMFFVYYNGNAIPAKALWLTLSFFSMVAGAYLVANYKLRHSKSQENQSSNRVHEIQQLMQTGERIRVTLDNCEVKSRSYHQEVVNDRMPSELDMLDALSNSGHYGQQVVQQTYIVFYKEYNSQTYKFISPATSWDAVAIKMYLDREGGLDLYIDKHDPSNYHFNFPFV